MMGLTLKETKIAADGRFLYLVDNERGEKQLLEPLNLTLSSKERMYIELLSDLRQIIQKPLDIKGKLKIVCYLGIVKFKEETCLMFSYDDELWKNWPRKGLKVYSPREVAEAAIAMLGLVEIAEETELAFGGFFPGDLFPLGSGGWGMLDPRIQNLLAPYRRGGEDREYYSPPEVIAGSSWSAKSYLYTLGLTMYSLVTGVFPFPLENRRETVTAILQEEPIDPRYYQGEIGEGLAILILKMLKKKVELRPDHDYLKKEFGRIVETGSFDASPEEGIKFREEAVLVKKKVEQKRKRYWRWQRFKWPSAIAAVALIFFIMLSRGGYEEKITPETKPLEVVNIFYEGIKNLDTLQLEEPLAKGVGKEFVNMVTFLHVTSKMRQAYELLNTPFLVMEEVTIEEDKNSTREAPSYTVNYRLKIFEGGEYRIQERQDRLVLKRVKKEWRIGDLDSQVLTEKLEPILGEDPSQALDR